MGRRRLAPKRTQIGARKRNVLARLEQMMLSTRNSDEEDILIRAVEEYESELRRSKKMIEISQCQHVFRHVSEWDPRKSNYQHNLGPAQI